LPCYWQEFNSVQFRSYLLTAKSTANCAITETAQHKTQKQKKINKANMQQTERKKKRKKGRKKERKKRKKETNKHIKCH